MPAGFDVVIVPDFLGARSHVFEARALFFLASWLENAGQARNFPLHLACIGEPPRSVRSLAARCDAMITVHLPYESGGFWNKLRGLEIQKCDQQVLLVDVDTIVCGDISGLGELGHCIAVAPTGLPGVPEPYWGRIYKALGMDPPTERIASLVGELNIPLPKRADPSGRYSAYKAMLPYYNSGVIFAPWDCGLRRFWEQHLRTISLLFGREDVVGQRLAKEDQPSLATAIEALKRGGILVRRLPRQYNADLTYIYRSGVKPAEIKIVHAIGLFASLGQNGTGIRAEIASFLGEELRSVARDLLRTDIDSTQRASVVRYLLPSVRKAAYLGLLLEKLHRRYVQPLLGHSN